MAKETILADLVNWTQIERQFTDICHRLRGIQFLSGDAFEDLRANRLTYGHYTIPEDLKISYGAAHYVVINERFPALRDAWIELADEIGAEVANDLKIERPEWWSELPNHFDLVEKAIALRTVDQDFVTSWARVNFLDGRYVTLLEFDEHASGILASDFKGSLAQSREVQRIWFAHWINENSPSLSRHDRADAINDIAQLCLDVRKDVVAPWGMYPKEWYSRLLFAETVTSKTKSGHAKRTQQFGDDIGARFEQLEAAQLTELLKHPRFTKDVLPPLSRSAFKAVANRGPRSK